MKELHKYLPPNALKYTQEIWEETPFNLTVTHPRKGKLGDCSVYEKTPKKNLITINDGLSPEVFLIVYLHEVAHLRAYTKYGLKISPHGIEWKTTFSNLLAPVLTPEIFPEEILVPLRDYARSPTATLGTHKELHKALFPELKKEGFCRLENLPDNALFEVKGHIFKKGKKRRTRYSCVEISTQAKYIVSAHCWVKPLTSQLPE